MGLPPLSFHIERAEGRERCKRELKEA